MRCVNAPAAEHMLLSVQVLAVEVLWTPQDEGDYFTRDDLATDFPNLNTL